MKSTVAAVFAAFLGLTGCVEKVTQVSFLDKVLTASEFTAQQPGDYQYECSFHVRLG